jgi:hypothetical protein
MLEWYGFERSYILNTHSSFFFVGNLIHKLEYACQPCHKHNLSPPDHREIDGALQAIPNLAPFSAIEHRWPEEL